MMKSLSADDQKGLADGWHAMGLHNHSFSPCAAEGPCICIWESKEPMTAEAFQQFIDGDQGPGGGKVFTNDVFLAMAGAKLPSAYFPKTAAFAAEAKATYEVDASAMWAVMKDWGAPHIVELGPATIEDVSGQGVGATRTVCFPAPDGSVAKWSEKVVSVDESAMRWSYILMSELPFDLKTDTFV